MIPTIEEILVKLANGDMSIDDADAWIRQHLSMAEDTAHLRDLFAGLAMQAFVQEYVHDNSDDIADRAFTLADAMLKARAR
jgi:hypothetical protein